MTDAYYRERSSRRTRNYLVIGTIIVSIACIGFLAYSLLFDDCTSSYDRQPVSVARSFVESLSFADAARVESCWEHFSYFNVESGCSEICLSRVMGKEISIIDVQEGDELKTSEGRANIKLLVDATCANGESHQGELTLDSIASKLPWRHWKIIYSTFGGTLADPWCQ
jgi:hypothetical protein